MLMYTSVIFILDVYCWLKEERIWLKTTDYAINEERPYGILIAGHYTETAGYSIHRPPDPVGWLLMYTLTGEGQVQVAGEAMPCRPGDVVILLPGLPHQYGTAGAGWEFIGVHFIPDPFFRPWLNLPQQSQGFVRLHVDGRPGSQNRRCRRVFAGVVPRAGL